MAFSQKQAEWFDNAGHRWNFKTGAVRSGKTFADFYTIPKRIRARVGKPGLAFIFGVSKSTIERNILEPMREIWGDHLVGGIKSDNTARLFGETVYCLGCEKVSQVAKIRGASIKYAYGDEVAEWNEEVFDLIKSRLDKPYSCFDGALNPESPNHWLKAFLESNADIYEQHYTIFDNPFLTKEFVENLCHEYEGTVYYGRYIKGEWTLAEGLIFPMYQDAIAEPPENSQISAVCLSVDYGTQNAFAALIWAKYGDVWHAVEEYYYSGRDKGIQKTDEEYAKDLDEFIKPYTNGRIETIIDPSAASFITLLQKRGGYRVRHADNAVSDGIRETATALKRGTIKISPECVNWIKEAQGYAWDEKATEDKPVKEADHLMDSMRYFVKTKHIAVPKRQGTSYLL